MTNPFLYDSIVLDDFELKQDVRELFKLETNCVTLCTVDVESVMGIMLAVTDDIEDKSLEDVQHLVENIILETTDLKNFADYKLSESDAVIELQTVSRSIALVLRQVLHSIENLGLPNGYFPYCFRHVLPNHTLFFARSKPN